MHIYEKDNEKESLFFLHPEYYSIEQLSADFPHDHRL